MLPVEIKPNIYWVGVNDHQKDLFEGLWPVKEEGVSYNAYLVKGEKNALIDLASGETAELFLSQLQRVLPLSELDYIIMNHIEPDHSGALSMLRKMAPNVEILCTKRAGDMLKAFYQIEDGVRIVGDGDKLDLGGFELQFVSTPNVHWPETMMTYEPKHGILFSCDGFGGYGALTGGIFDDEYEDITFYEQESLRYFVNIVATFNRPVLKAIEKLSDVEVSIVAPSHGLIWRNDPELIISLYKQWSEAGLTGGVEGITLLYGSMYGSTYKIMDAVAQGIRQEGLDLDVFDVNKTHISYILPSMYLNKGFLLGVPTYEGGLFPPAANALHMMDVKKITQKTAARFGSFGWKAGKTDVEFNQFAESMKWQVEEPLQINGGPTEEELKQAVEFGAAFARKVKASAE